MALTETVSLGKVPFKGKMHRLNMPQLELDFYFDIDSKHTVMDEELQKLIRKNGPKMLKKRVKETMERIEKALGKVDQDLMKERNALYKKHKVKEGKTLTHEQGDAIIDFNRAEEKKVTGLQKYLQQIVDGINKTDARKWMEEVYDACYDKLEKVIKDYKNKRTKGGRVKIVIIGAVGVVATGLAVTATVLSAGTAAVLIIGIIAAGAGLAAKFGTAAVGWKKLSGFLRQKRSALADETANIESLVEQCANAQRNADKNKKAFLRDSGLSEKEYNALFPKGTVDPAVLFPKLKKHKETFRKFEKHLKDIEMLSVQGKMSLDAAVKIHAQTKEDYEKALKELKEVGDKAAFFNTKKGKKLKKYFQECPARLAELQKNIAHAKLDLKALDDLVTSARRTKADAMRFKGLMSGLKDTQSALGKTANICQATGDIATGTRMVLGVVAAASSS